VILRLYKGPAEVLMGFDLDCATFGYDGQRVWCLPRGRRAVNAMCVSGQVEEDQVRLADQTRRFHRCNVVDATRQSQTYEYRYAAAHWLNLGGH
jgi:hypothetical protein